jgi:hypothetical protein
MIDVIEAIQSDNRYQEVLYRLLELEDAPPGSEEEKEARALSRMVKAYEADNFPI